MELINSKLKLVIPQFLVLFVLVLFGFLFRSIIR